MRCFSFSGGRSIFRVSLFVLLHGCLLHAAMPDINLPNSSVRLPWSVFTGLFNRKPDTVFIPPETAPPTAITFEKMHLTAALRDSMAEMSLAVDYMVLAREGWAEAPVFDADHRCALSSVRLSEGDFLRSTDAGYLLTADATNERRSRQLSLGFTVPAQSDAGIVSVQTSLPQAVQCVLDISAPPSYAEVTVHNAFLSEKRRIKGTIRYRYLMDASGNECEITYMIPVKKIDIDSIAHVEREADERVKEPVVSVRQESAVFPTKGSLFIYTALHLNVVRAPIIRFTVELPDSFSLLSLSGNGMQSWKKPDRAAVLEVNLGFELEGSYTLHLAGELPADTNMAIPAFKVCEAAHQTGMFALGIEQGGEALFISAHNCIDISLNEFLGALSPGYSDSIIRYGYSLQNIALAGQFVKLPFSAIVLVRRHVPVPVADALCDAGLIRTVISKDAKILTQVNFLVRHGDRQFIALALPDSIHLWAVTLDGRRIAPSVDDSGRYKVSLQRHSHSTAAGRSALLEITYLQTMKSAASDRTFHLQAPVADIPVGRLEWAVFYPDRWYVKKTGGTFTAAQTTLFGQRFFTLDRGERQSMYRRLQESNTKQQTTDKAASALTLMPESPKHLYASTILVVDEQPWIEIRFGSNAVRRLLTVLLTICGIGAVVGAVILWRQMMTDRKASPVAQT